MDKKQIVLGIIALWVSIPVWGREITIEECYRKAQANYPLIKQYDLIEKSREYSVSNANKGYLPQISFSAKASYQSDVTKLPFDFSRLGISTSTGRRSILLRPFGTEGPPGLAKTIYACRPKSKRKIPKLRFTR